MKKLVLTFYVFFTFIFNAISPLEAKAKPLRLVLNWKPEAEFGGFYAAQVEGYFKQKNLEVEIIPGGAATPTIQMIAADQTEFAIVSSEELVVSRAKGTDVVALFAVHQNSPMAIMTHKERGFKSIQDVFQSPGILAIQSGLPFYTFLEKKLGKPKAKVVPYLGGISNFLTNSEYSQQGYIISEPLLAKKKGAKTQSFLISDEGYNPYMTVLVARRSFINKNQEMVKLLVSTIKQGWRSYLEHPDKTNQFMHRLNPAVDLASFKEIAEAQKPFIETKETKKLGLGVMTQERWKKLAEQLQEIQLVKQAPDISQIYLNY